ncbi:MAG: hypothetical protein HY270_07045 [Deltaproteobacteria bacterium]|nr:hypothetical protein [Deltaproteobacteria bacterium]
MKWRFAGLFLLTFAVLVTAWWAIDFGVHYRTAVLESARTVSPLVNGWWLDYDQPGMVDPVVFRSGGRQLPMLLQLPALSMALMPLISLIVATPHQSIRRRFAAAVIGGVAFFGIHVVVVLVYPFIMDRPNVVKDTLGVFSGLVAFVVGPLGLWFALTYPALRSVWQIDPQAARKQ